MESPFYEMTHDIEAESRISNESYKRGYDKGFIDGSYKLTEWLLSLDEDQLQSWIKMNKNWRKLGL